MSDDERLFPLPDAAAATDAHPLASRRCRGCATELEGLPASQDGAGLWRCMTCTLEAVAAGEPALLIAAPDQLTLGGDADRDG